MSVKIAISMATICFITGCSLKPKLVRHYSEIGSENVDPPTIQVGSELPSPEDLIKGGRYYVSAFVTLPPSKQTLPPFLLSLSNEGQAATVTELGKLNADSRKFSQSLFELGQKSSGCNQTGSMRFERRVVFSLIGRHSLPAIRFDSVAYKLSTVPPLDSKGSSHSSKENHTKFISWNRFETLAETTTLGTTGYKQNQSISLTDVDSETKTVAAIAGTIPGRQLLDSLTLNASQSRELNESVVSTRRLTPYTNSISNNAAVVLHQGVVGVDLFGNFAADFTIELIETKLENFFSFTGIFDAKGKPQQNLDEINIEVCERRSAESIKNVLADLSVAAVLREIRKGGETAIEGDDSVEYKQIKPESTDKTAKIVILSENDLMRDAYRIGIYDKEQDKNLFLEISNGDSNGQGMLLISYGEARDLVRWLRLTGKESIKEYGLKWPNGAAYKSSSSADLNVYLCKDPIASECGLIWK